MLPRLLCEELCSLNPLTDRLTFSVIWKITPEGKVPLTRICYLLERLQKKIPLQYVLLNEMQLCIRSWTSGSAVLSSAPV